MTRRDSLNVLNEILNGQDSSPYVKGLLFGVKEFVESTPDDAATPPDAEMFVERAGTCVLPEHNMPFVPTVVLPKQGEWLIIPPGWSVRQVGKDELA